jgi:uncharacterized membrane protein YbhN (UPF0104 family)
MNTRVGDLRRHVVVRIAGIAISIACLVYVVVQATRVWDSAGAALLEGDTLARLCLALIPITLAYLAAALAWVVLLRSFGARARLLPTAGAYLAAQVGKYLPGNVGHYVGRVVLGARVGNPASTVALAMTVEFVLLIFIAIVLGAPLLPLIWARLAEAWHALPSARLVVLAACIGVAALALFAVVRLRPALRRFLGEWETQLRAPLGSAGAAGRFGFSITLWVAVFALSSASLVVLGESGEWSFEVLRAVVGLYSVAWIVGVLTPGAPGGIGVREALLIEGLTPLWGAGEAVAGALLFRVVTVAADVIALGLGVAAMKFPDTEIPAAPPPESPRRGPA